MSFYHKPLSQLLVRVGVFLSYPFIAAILLLLLACGFVFLSAIIVLTWFAIPFLPSSKLPLDEGVREQKCERGEILDI